MAITRTTLSAAITADERFIALGSTTNLAARLQVLTRDLEAAMVIDLATQRAAGEVAANFDLREQLRIRGRVKREDVYLLPLVS